MWVAFFVLPLATLLMALIVPRLKKLAVGESGPVTVDDLNVGFDLVVGTIVSFTTAIVVKPQLLTTPVLDAFIATVWLLAGLLFWVRWAGRLGSGRVSVTGITAANVAGLLAVQISIVLSVTTPSIEQSSSLIASWLGHERSETGVAPTTTLHSVTTETTPNNAVDRKLRLAKSGPSWTMILLIIGVVVLVILLALAMILLWQQQLLMRRLREADKELSKDISHELHTISESLSRWLSIIGETSGPAANKPLECTLSSPIDRGWRSWLRHLQSLARRR